MRSFLTSNLPIVADSPNGVRKLRELILQLAVQGKLIPQDANDEPASELVKRMQKLQGTKSRALRKHKLFPKNSEYNDPFPLPSGWVWIQLGEIGDWGAGATPLRSNSDYYGGSIFWFKSGELNDDVIRESSDETVTDLALKECSLRENQVGDVLIAMYGATIGKTAILGVPGTTNQAVCACTPFTGVYNRFLHTVLKAMKSALIRQGSGGAQPNISREKIIAMTTALPPLAEQHRIVEKVDELMSLCDRLENQQLDAEDAHFSLVKVLLGTLVQAKDESDFATKWNLVKQNFEVLFTTEASIEALKQAILQLSVMGKIVAQDPNDEPAEKILARIQKKRENLLQSGTLKKDKKFWDGLPTSPPFSVPPSWKWVRLQDVYEVSRGGSPRPAGDPRFFGGDIPWVTVAEITKDDGKFLNKTAGGLTPEGTKRSRFIEPGDLLLTNSGATLGVPKISNIKGCINDGVALLRQFHDESLNDFAYLFLFSETASFRRVNQGMGQPNLNTSIIAGWFMPMPPLSEQRRIVEKVGELMMLCNQLRDSLAEARSCQDLVSSALIKQALCVTASGPVDGSTDLALVPT